MTIPSKMLHCKCEALMWDRLFGVGWVGSACHAPLGSSCPCPCLFLTVCLAPCPCPCSSFCIYPSVSPCLSPLLSSPLPSHRSLSLSLSLSLPLFLAHVHSCAHMHICAKYVHLYVCRGRERLCVSDTLDACVHIHIRFSRLAPAESSATNGHSIGN